MPEDNKWSAVTALAFIYPVLLAVPAAQWGLVGREKVAYLSAHARQALAMSAQKAGLALGELAKDTAGAPLPSNGVFWSLAHKSDYVAAIAADIPVGIDLEKIADVSAGMYRKIATGAEWHLSTEERRHLFFRYWTAKEAVLKVAGTGIRELSHCRVTAVVDDHNLRLDFKGIGVRVRHFFHDQHVVAVVDPGCSLALNIKTTP